MPPNIRLLFLALLAALSLTACAKTVSWEEEVPLNSGETLWVQRSVDYELAGDAGNPFDISYKPRLGTYVLTFTWRGKSYRFDNHGGPMVLAISPQGQPVILAQAAAGAWYATNG